MLSWKRSGSCLAVIVWLGCCAAPAGAGPVTRAASPAETDSLVWYVEELEHDLLLCQVRAGASRDSLALRCDDLAQRLAWAQQDQRRWYHDPRLWFLVGAAAATLVMAATLQVSF